MSNPIGTPIFDLFTSCALPLVVQRLILILNDASLAWMLLRRHLLAMGHETLDAAGVEFDG